MLFIEQLTDRIEFDSGVRSFLTPSSESTIFNFPSKFEMDAGFIIGLF